MEKLRQQKIMKVTFFHIFQTESCCCFCAEIWVLLTSNFNIFVVTSALGVVASAALKRRQLLEFTCRAGALQNSKLNFHNLQMQALSLTACWSKLKKKDAQEFEIIRSEVVDFARLSHCTMHSAPMIWNKYVTPMLCFLLHLIGTAVKRSCIY